MTELPASFYSIIGILVVGQLSTLITLLVFVFKAGRYTASTEYANKDAKDTAVRAHLRIDNLEGKKYGEI
jgi:hypothetical protein